MFGNKKKVDPPMNHGDEGEISYAEDEELVNQFIAWTENALVELRQLTDGLSGGESKSHKSAERIYDLGHNIKGMGSSFNYSLMTDAGASLCSYLKSLDPAKMVSRRVIDAHVRLFEVVLQHRIKGDGGERGKALMDRIAAIIREEA